MLKQEARSLDLDINMSRILTAKVTARALGATRQDLTQKFAPIQTTILPTH